MFSEPIVWRNTKVLKVSGITVKPGVFTSREGREVPFNTEMCKSLFSNFESSTPSYLTHDDRDSCGYMYKLGYDEETDTIHYEGFVFDPDKADRIVNDGFDSVSPEIEVDKIDGKITGGKITGIAFVRNPAIKGTTVNKMYVSFSTPTHTWDYNKSDSSWSKPALKDFTEKSWEELSNTEKREIAAHFAYAVNMPPASFGDLKFPHHDPKTHDVVWKAVANAMARLNQADISDADKKAVYNHLVKHYKEFEKEPPEMFDDGCVNNMVNTSYTMTSTNGSYSFVPITVSSTGVNFSEPDAKDLKIKELENKIASFEAASVIVPPVVVPEVPKAPEMPRDPEVDYKSKYDSIMKNQIDSIEGELKNLGVKGIESIGSNLDSETRYNILRAFKESFVINKPTTTPPETIQTQPVGESKEQKIEKLMKENGIDSSYKKYIKVN